MNAAGGEHINSTTEEIFEVLTKADQVEQRSIRIHVNEKIQIAGRTGFPAGLRSEHANVLGSVSVRDPQDVRTATLKVCHGIQPDHRVTHDTAGSHT
jgi:hypothetical protein